MMQHPNMRTGLVHERQQDFLRQASEDRRARHARATRPRPERNATGARLPALHALVATLRLRLRSLARG